MSYDLLIVESPNKVKKLTEYLGGGFKVSATVGHFRDLPPKARGVSAGDFRPEYEFTQRGREVIAKLKPLAAGARNVYLGTDPDREGEAIAQHLVETLNLRSPQRVRFGELTKAAVQKAIGAPTCVDRNLVIAQEARRVYDRLVGWDVSPALSNVVGEPASAGRVQTPALIMVVDRAREIRDFQSRTHYGVTLTFAGGAGSSSWKAAWHIKPHLTDGETLWMDPDVAKQLSEIRDVVVARCDNTTARSAPPPPFITSTLQRAASVRFRMKPKKTMDVAQKLFADGHINYHRSDSPNLSMEAIAAIRNLAQERGLALPDGSRTWKAKESAQEGHEAIRPTHLEVESAGETDDERKLYRLIWERAVASQLADSEYAVRTAVLRSAVRLGAKPVDFVARGRVMTKAGWRALVEADQTDESEVSDEANNPVPELAERAALRAESGKCDTKQTKPPAQYTQASLIAALEAVGVGRPSTYASIMSTLEMRGYVEEDAKGKLSPTTLGEKVADALKPKFSFADPGFTAEMETELDFIADGGSSYLEFMRRANNRLVVELDIFGGEAPPGPPCPDGACTGVLRRRKGNYGHFWSCSRFREGCKTPVYPDKDGAPDFTPRAVYDGPSEKCPRARCAGELRPRERSRGAFWGCTKWRDGCSTIYNDVNGKPDVANPIERKASSAPSSSRDGNGKGRARSSSGGTRGRKS